MSLETAEEVRSTQMRAQRARLLPSPSVEKRASVAGPGGGGRSSAASLVSMVRPIVPGGLAARCCLLWTVTVAVGIGVAPPARGGHGGWMPLTRFQEMDIVERRYYSRALKLLDQKHFKAAAAEFEKFKVQFPDSPAMPYLLFYRGLSLHLGNFRLRSIDAYTEVLDYFSNDVDPSVKALYQIGIAYEQNGDTRESQEAFREIADDTRYVKHGLAAPALRRLGDSYYKKEKTDRAIELWMHVYAQFLSTRQNDAVYCRNRLANHFLSRAMFDSYSGWLTRDTPLVEEESDPEATRYLWIYQFADDLVWQGVHRNAWNAKAWSKRRIRDFRKAYARYFDESSSAYTEGGAGWDYYTRLLRFTRWILEDEKAHQAAIDRALASLEEDLAKEDNWDLYQRLLWLHTEYQPGNRTCMQNLIKRMLDYVRSETDPRAQWTHYGAILDIQLAQSPAGKATTETISAMGKFIGAQADPGFRWTCLLAMMDKLLPVYGEKAHAQKAVATAMAFARGLPLATGRDPRLVEISDRLKGAGFAGRALLTLDGVSNPALRLYKTYEIVGPLQQKWNDAIEILLKVEATNNRHYEPLAREQRASVYKNKLNDYEKAIALYYEISDPPRTLWEIQDCYYRWNKLEKALMTLKEIEAIFPAQAPAAAWRRAVYYDRKKARENVIVEARRILKIYRKSRESSQAHQLLEKYGIATGGGVMDEDE